MFYKVIRTYSYRMSTLIEAESEEQALELSNSYEHDHEWIEEDSDPHFIEDEYVMTGITEDGEIAENEDDIHEYELL